MQHEFIVNKLSKERLFFILYEAHILQIHFTNHRNILILKMTIHMKNFVRNMTYRIFEKMSFILKEINN